jgi:hypothetical protein
VAYLTNQPGHQPVGGINEEITEVANGIINLIIENAALC